MRQAPVGGTLTGQGSADRISGFRSGPVPNQFAKLIACAIC